MEKSSKKIWDKYFVFRGKNIPYNRISYNNLAERAVEVPLAFAFLAELKDKISILEIGNVLQNYENILSSFFSIDQRKIIDKYEIAAGVENIDLMDMPPAQKYTGIVCISTVEHVGQKENSKEPIDREAPLKAIVKIYDLLEINGEALVTVPFGKLIDGGWYIQFSNQYLGLLVSKYKIPAEAIEITILKKTGMEISGTSPFQEWEEVNADSVNEVEFGLPWPWANSVAFINLKKISSDFKYNTNFSETKFNYEKPVLMGGIFHKNINFFTEITDAGTFLLKEPGFIFSTSAFKLKPDSYKFYLNIKSVPQPFIFSLKTRENIIFSKKIHSSGKAAPKFQIKNGDDELFLSLYYEGDGEGELFINNLELRYSD
jgi:hypothetical protein